MTKFTRHALLLPDKSCIAKIKPHQDKELLYVRVDASLSNLPVYSLIDLWVCICVNVDAPDGAKDFKFYHNNTTLLERNSTAVFG